MRTIEATSTPGPIPRRQVFRQEAMRAYAEANNRPVLPRFTTPFAIVCCWLLVLLLGASAVLVLSARVPLTASGMAIVSGYGDDGTATVLVVMPPGSGAAVQPGDDVYLRIGAYAGIQPLVSLHEAPGSTGAIAAQFGLDHETASTIAPRSNVGVVRVDVLAARLDPPTIGRVEIEVGTQPLGAVLPIVGKFLS